MFALILAWQTIFSVRHCPFKGQWKAIFQDTKKENNQRKYGLCSFKIPPPVKDFATFKFELIELVKNKIPKSEKQATKSTEGRHKKDQSVR